MNRIVTIIEQILSEPHSSLLKGILLGSKANFSPELYQALISTGTVHLIAASGQNISIVTRVVSDISLRWGRRVSLAVTLASIMVYAILVGGDPPIIRASIMGSFSLLAVYFGRQNWSLLSLFWAGILMYIINPAWIATLSFQLSFLSTLGIILLAGTAYSKPKTFIEELKKELVLNLKVTLAAQLFTLPILVTTFRELSLISPVTNLLVGWLIGPIFILGGLATIFGLLYLPAGQLAGWLLWPLLSFVIRVIELTARIPYAVFEF